VLEIYEDMTQQKKKRLRKNEKTQQDGEPDDTEKFNYLHFDKQGCQPQTKAIATTRSMALYLWVWSHQRPRYTAYHNHTCHIFRI